MSISVSVLVFFIYFLLFTFFIYCGKKIKRALQRTFFVAFYAFSHVFVVQLSTVYDCGRAAVEKSAVSKSSLVKIGLQAACKDKNT